MPYGKLNIRFRETRLRLRAAICLKSFRTIPYTAEVIKINVYKSLKKFGNLTLYRKLKIAEFSFFSGALFLRLKINLLHFT